MKIMPAVDIMEGRCVQLVGGDPDTRKDYGDPIQAAKKWVESGARMLHVIDLDATLGRGDNLNILKEIRGEIDVPIQFGGGVRSREKIKEVLDLGIDRVIVGTLGVKDYENSFKILEDMKKQYGEKIILAVDSKDGYVAVKGWQEDSGLKTIDLIKDSQKHVWGFLYTDVKVEGQMRGVNIEEVQKVVKSSGKPVIISGGITTKKDLQKIKEAGAWGVVLGKALYEGRLKLGEYVF